MVAALGSELVARGVEPSPLDLPADSSMPVELVHNAAATGTAR
jgi:N6-L-threonylcarbamoyladenine synthase